MAMHATQHRVPLTSVAAANSEKLWGVIAGGYGALVVLSFLAPVDSISVFVGSALPQNLGWLLLAVMAAFASRTSRVRICPTRTEVVLVGLGLGWLIVTSRWGASHGNGRAVWNGFWQIMALASCFYIGRALMCFPRVREAMSLLLIIGCTALSIEGLEQVYIAMPASRADYAKNPDRMLAEQGIDAPPGSPHRKQFEDRLNSPEPFATFALANSLATLLCLGVVLNGGWLANTWVSDQGPSQHISTKFKWSRTAALAITLTTQLICLLLTRSRTAYLALGLSLGLWLILELLRGRVRLSSRAVRFGGVAMGLLALVGFAWLLTVDELVWSEAPKSVGYRLEYWQATLAMIREHPWAGVGLGNFQAYYPQYKLEQASEIIADPHNWILDIAASLSVPMAVLLVGWVAVTLATGIRTCLINEPASEKDPGHLARFSPEKDHGRLARFSSEKDHGRLARFSSEKDPGRLARNAPDAGTHLTNAPTWIAGKTSSNEQIERWLLRGLLFGAVAGGSIAAACLAFTGNLDLQLTAMAWGSAGLLGWLSSRSGAGEVSAANQLAAAIVVWLCLLASGSWQASGIAVPLLALMAMAWSRSGRGAESPKSCPKGWMWPGLAALGLIIFVVQTWRPVTQSWMWSEGAAAAQSLDERLRLIEFAAAADPSDADRQLQVAEMLAAKAMATQAGPAFAVDGQHVLERLERLASSGVAGYILPKVAGQICFDLAAGAAQRGLQNESYLNAARDYYGLAVERYPSSVEMLIQHAAAEALVGNWLKAAESLEKATQISQRTPHLDKKLAAQLIWLPLKLPGFEADAGYVSAEPLTNWLRTEAKAKSALN